VSVAIVKFVCVLKSDKIMYILSQRMESLTHVLTVAVESVWRLVTTIYVLTRRFMNQLDGSSAVNCSVFLSMT